MNNKNLISQPSEAHNSSCKGTQAADVASDATRLYLRDIGHTPLLTAEEEVFYGRCALQGTVQAGAE